MIQGQKNVGEDIKYWETENKMLKKLGIKRMMIYAWIIMRKKRSVPRSENWLTSNGMKTSFQNTFRNITIIMNTWFTRNYHATFKNKTNIWNEDELIRVNIKSVKSCVYRCSRTKIFTYTGKFVEKIILEKRKI